MTILKRRVVDNEIESRIIIGLIISDVFIRKIMPALKKEYFVGEFAGVVFEWCKDYFKAYQEAPQKQIKDIYEDNKDFLSESQMESVGIFLKRLSDNYEEEENFNIDYLYDKAVEYIEGRAIRITSEKALEYLDNGRVDKARQELSNHKKIAKDCSSWVNPFDAQFIADTFLEEEKGVDNLFILPGALGTMVGYHQRGWLISILAPKKRGKSFFLMEMAYRAFLSRCRVLIFSLEMSEKRIEKRLLKRITAEGKFDSEYLYPCFDCYHNQSGTCQKTQRQNRIALFIQEGIKPPFKKDMKYKPCVACRGTSDYQVATWYKTQKRNKQSMGKAIRKAKALTKMYGDNLRLKSFPAGTATLNDLQAVMDSLEYTENFIPDVIIVDYADILKPMDNRLHDERAKSNETWIALKGWADQRHCAVITATQGNKGSIERKNIKQTDYSEDIRKGAHIDLGYGISQTNEEKFESVMRISVLEHRDEDTNEMQQALVLQQRGLGQVLLDSELVGTINYMEDETGFAEMMRGE